jgi:uncharacterized membrane protein
MIKTTRVSHVVTIADVLDALVLGWRDFKRAPLFGLFFGGIFAGGGLLLYYLLGSFRSVWLILPLAIGFPLIGPFAAAGLYEVSRILGRGQQPKWGDVLTVTIHQGRRELGWMAFVTLFIFWVWMYQVRLMVALFMGFKGFASLDGFLVALTQNDGLTFLMAGTTIGAVLAFVLFCSTVVAIPLLLHRDIDFITALINSWRSVFENLPAMLFFGLCVAALTIIAMLPMFLGLLVIMPVLGHATWHLYVKSRHIEDRPV